jgi:hypothetical protein
MKRIRTVLIDLPIDHGVGSRNDQESRRAQDPVTFFDERTGLRNVLNRLERDHDVDALVRQGDRKRITNPGVDVVLVSGVQHRLFTEINAYQRPGAAGE